MVGRVAFLMLNFRKLSLFKVAWHQKTLFRVYVIVRHVFGVCNLFWRKKKRFQHFFNRSALSLNFWIFSAYLAFIEVIWYILAKDLVYLVHGRNLVGDTEDVSPPLFQTGGT